MNDDLILEIDDDNDIDLELDDESELVLTDDVPYYEKETNYENLENKPQINNVTLIGNKFLQDLFPDGIIINGGTATEVV